ncbi:hypothetical protein KIN20_031181 [Parelaphostrongylus tenuis]|uniref:Uncharacterized protein n=1 Tax=Parelaphostrongylus tenuis TaxID=148309 RepID=A0AAD5WHF3_PARTN|nr:hypothetical protein KIN20_031181 [Parelaphostrongylus tenuis]
MSSQENPPSDSWPLLEYVDLQNTVPCALLRFFSIFYFYLVIFHVDKNLVVRLFKAQRLLRVQIGVDTIEQIFLNDHSLSAEYGDTAVLLNASGASPPTEFCILFSTAADRHSFCMAVREFITVEESQPVYNYHVLVPD